ncbi:hypothetical protein BX616_003420 [Lobosporangium transversale]|uniref:Uncharacterized protein n=1 Tax=Lobosporangium transversale TaxID=64571 RepID=A0A1Y2GXF8_9FUNG|nr:hypothetical protein BCR41DRAFT_348752 [Lobosporangium transversale]KAF9916573.1 hypothetical protein BX616_003420 [Lobosporangium transversale]ORZ24937.1 hypothetical protein BCR41DRAFT_348752 [Lobosporangium transversale]|eukprot:XP_021883918.1 hypothetical protein BCR41DRAFT_348752 [Lobosporangium transversale]
MNDINDRHPSCIHSASHHNTVSKDAGPPTCSCEECARYKIPPQSEQCSATDGTLEQQHANMATMSISSARDGNINATSATSPPRTYLTRRASASASPRMQPAGFGSPTAQVAPHQRRASVEFHNRERSFQEHSTSCDCRGSGVGCQCSYTCDC